MSPAIEAALFAVTGGLLIFVGFIIRRRITKMRFFAFVYAGALFLLGAVLTLSGWIRPGASSSQLDFYARIAGACFFLYLAFIQRRKRTDSIVWVLYLIGGIGIGLTAVFHI